MASLLGSLIPSAIVEDLPDLRWNATTVPSLDYTEALPDLRWPAALVDSVPTRWLMRALTDPGGVLIYWVSFDAPDYTGDSAPEAVQVSTIVLVKQVT